MADWRRQLLFVVPVLLFLVVGGFLYVGLFLDPKQIPSALINKPVPEFDLPALPGHERGLSSKDLNGGQVSLVNVFASWCGPCRIEHPFLMRLKEESGVPLYGINYKDKIIEAQRFLDELGDPFTAIGADYTGRAAIDWGVYGIPETFLIDRDGRIACKQIGPISKNALELKLMPAIAAAKAGERVTC